MTSLLLNLKELYKFREVIYALSEREIKSRYKQSVIGVLWAIIQPFTLMVIFTLVFDKFFKINSNTDIPYPILVYSTLVPWNFFSKSLVNSTYSLVGNRSLVTKVFFPKEVLPISLIAANVFDFLAAGLILILMMIFYKVGFTINLIFLIPIFLLTFILTLSFSLFLSAANVSFRDIGNVINLVIQIWMYGSPIIYSTSNVPEKYYFWYMIINPLSPVMEAFRRIIAAGKPPEWKYIFISFISSLFLLIINYAYFKHSEKTFADII